MSQPRRGLGLADSHATAAAAMLPGRSAATSRPGADPDGEVRVQQTITQPRVRVPAREPRRPRLAKVNANVSWEILEEAKACVHHLSGPPMTLRLRDLVEEGLQLAIARRREQAVEMGLIGEDEPFMRPPAEGLRRGVR